MSEVYIQEANLVKHHRGHHRTKCSSRQPSSPSPEESRLKTNSSWPKLSYHSSADADSIDNRLHWYSKSQSASRERLPTGAHESRICSLTSGNHGKSRSNYFENLNHRRRHSSSHDRRPSSADPRFHRIVLEESQVIEPVLPKLADGSKCTDYRKKEIRTRTSDSKRAMSLSPSNIKNFDWKDDFLKSYHSCSRGVQTDENEISLAMGSKCNGNASLQDGERERGKHQHRSRNPDRHTRSSRKKDMFDCTAFLSTDAERQFSWGNPESDCQLKQLKDEKNWDKMKLRNLGEVDDEVQDNTSQKNTTGNTSANNHKKIKKHGWLKPSTDSNFCMSQRNMHRTSQDSSNNFDSGCASNVLLKNTNVGVCSRLRFERNSDADQRGTLNSRSTGNVEDLIEEADIESESYVRSLSKPKKRLLPRTNSYKGKLNYSPKRNGVLVGKRTKSRAGQVSKSSGGANPIQNEKPAEEVMRKGNRNARTWVIIISSAAAVFIFGVITLALLFYLPPSMLHWLFDFDEDEQYLLLLPRLFGKTSV